MITDHIHHALAQVKELQRHVLERQKFRGYSGEARAMAGTIALGAALVLGMGRVPATPTAHLLGWGVVFLLALCINYGAVMYWFLYDPHVRRDLRKLKPTIDVFPPLIVGAVLSVALVLRGEHDYLFGVWMCLYGLANLASRHVLPKAFAWVGLFYLAAGFCCLFIPQLTFTNPWPMGLTFFLGEWASGLILHFDQRRAIP
jgi:hypothetical protein